MSSGTRSRPDPVRIALIASADAGAGVGPDPVVRALRAAGAEPVAFERARLEEVPGSAPERLAVAGGDGSIGAVAALAGELGVPLAVIPTGTANNFAAVERLPRKLEAACALAASGERTRSVDLGHAGELPFVNLASAGLAPLAAERAARLKRVLGPAAYTVGAVAAAASGEPLDCELSVAGESAFRGRAWQAMVALSGAFGPGMRVEGAEPAGGMLDAVVLPAGSRLSLLRRGWWIRHGRIATQPGAVRRRAPRFELRVAPGTRFNVDGEVVALGTASFSVEPAAFRLVVG